MRTYLVLAGALVASQSQAGYFPRVHKEEFVTSRCFVVPEFKADKIRRVESGPGHWDRVNYSLDYRVKTTRLLIWVDGFGNKLHKEEVVTEAVKVVRFEMREDEGNEWDLGQKVKAYIEDELEPHRCSP